MSEVLVGFKYRGTINSLVSFLGIFEQNLSVRYTKYSLKFLMSLMASAYYLLVNINIFLKKYAFRIVKTERVYT